MRRTVICLLMCIAAYAGYIYTLPPAEIPAPAAQAAARVRVSARIDIPEMRLYAVSLGSFDTQSEALPHAAAYSARGAAGCVTETENGWEIIGTCCLSSAEAERICLRLSESEGIPARVMLFSSEKTGISVTAAQSQTDALAEALYLMQTVPDELMQLSSQIDSGKCTPGTARSLMSVRHTQVGRALDTLTAELGTTADIFSRMTETGLIELEEKLAVICAEDSPEGLYLSSLMKHCATETYLYIINMANALSL